MADKVQRIQDPELGVLEFPTSMSDADISNAIEAERVQSRQAKASQQRWDTAKSAAIEAPLNFMTGMGIPAFQNTSDYVTKPYQAYKEAAQNHPWLTGLAPIIGGPMLGYALGKGMVNSSQQAYQQMNKDLDAGNYMKAGFHLSSVVNPVSAMANDAAINTGEGIQQKDIPKVVGGVSNLAGQATAMLAGGPEGAAATDSIIGKVGQTANVLVPKTPLNFQQLLAKALRPATGKVFEVQTAAKELEPALKEMLEGDTQTLDTFQSAISNERKSIWKQSSKLKPNASQMVDGQDIHDAIISSISPRTKMVFPEVANSVEARAKNYLVLDKEGNTIGSKQIPINDAEQFLQEAHADLDPYYNKSPFQQATNIRSSADVAATQAETDGLRKAIHSRLANPELRKKYGLLSVLDQQAQRRQAQVAVAAMNDLPDRMTKTAAAFGVTKALFKADPQEAASVLAAYATNRAIKKGNLPDELLNKAFNPSILGSTVPSGIAGPVVTGNAATQHLVNWKYDPSSGSLVPADTPAQLQDQF